MLREVEVDLSRGKDVGQIFRDLGIAEQSCCRWRKNKRLEIESPLFQVGLPPI